MDNRLPDTPWHLGYAKSMTMLRVVIKHAVFTIKMVYAQAPVLIIARKNAGVPVIVETIRKV